MKASDSVGDQTAGAKVRGRWGEVKRLARWVLEQDSKIRRRAAARKKAGGDGEKKRRGGAKTKWGRWRKKEAVARK